MLTNGFTREEIAACAPGATINCTVTVVIYQSTKVAFTVGQEYKVLSMSDPTIMVVEDDNKSRRMLDGPFFRKHFTLGKPREVVHLSQTGLHAGRRFCGTVRDDGSRSVHAMYAPFQSAEFRARLCDACMATWAIEAYAEGDAMPAYIVEARAKHEAELAKVTPAAQLALETQ